MRTLINIISFFGTLLLSATPLFAQAYVQPRAGATLPVDGGDTSYSVGLSLGYQWNSYFATEATYERLFGSGDGADGDLLKGEGILGVPFKYVTPYVSGGAGMIHTSFSGNDDVDLMYLVGAGVGARPFRFLSLGVGVGYAIVQGGEDFVQPFVSVGFGF